MNGPYTLEQVKQAGLFAWTSQDVFVPGCGFLDIELRESYGYGETLCFLDRFEPTPYPSPDGWHHLPDCDCELCRE
jgi:hypothetical protein